MSDFYFPEQFKVNTVEQMRQIKDAKRGDTCVVVKPGYDYYFFNDKTGEWVDAFSYNKYLSGLIKETNNQ